MINSLEHLRDDDCEEKEFASKNTDKAFLIWKVFADEELEGLDF